MINRRNIITLAALALFPNRAFAKPSGKIVGQSRGLDRSLTLPISRSMRVVARRCLSALGSDGETSARIRFGSFTELSVLDPKDKVAQDFQEGRTVDVDGWVLAESEICFYIARSLQHSDGGV